MNERYSRHIMLPEIGCKGQERLLQSRVLIVGVGGLGSPVALYLAAAGVGCIGVMDDDVVSESNLQRQILYKTSEVGISKTYCASLRIKEISPTTIANTYNTRICKSNAKEMVSQYDIIVDCSDNAATRYLLDEVCATLSKPLVYGAIGEYCGQVSVFDATRQWRYIDLFPHREEALSIPPKTTGVIGTLPGIVGTIQANEVIKLITGLGESLIGKIFSIDIRSMDTNLITIKQ